MPYFFSRGTPLYYETYGDMNNPAVLLIHGLAADLKIWTPQVNELKKYFFICALDLPGHGHSETQKSYDIQTIPDILKEWIDYINIPQAHLIGHSIGCTIAILFSVRYPKSTLSLVLQGPAGGLIPFSNPSSWLSYLQLTLTLNLVILIWTIFGKKLSGKIINWFGQTYQYSTLLTGMEEEVDPKALKDLAYTN